MDETPQVADETVPQDSGPPDDAGESQAPNVADELVILTPLDPAFESRRKRILDHRLEAQTEANTLTACLAGVNSDLFEFQLFVGEALRQALGTSGNSIEEFELHSRPIDLIVRLSKQIAQITQLEIKTRKTGSAEDGAKK